MGRVGQIHAVQANLRYPQSVAAAVRDADIVINLVGILFERGRQRFDAVQAEGAEAVALAAKAAGAPLVHVSAIGADENSPSHYARSKADGERRVLAALPAATIMRPSIVFGPEDDFFNRFAALARMAPALPLPGGGQTRLSAGVRRRRRRGDRQGGRRRRQAGRDLRIWRAGRAHVQGADGIHRWRRSSAAGCLVPVPFALMKLQAMLLQFLPKPPLTPDQVELLKRDNIVSDDAKRDGRTLEALGIVPESMAAIVPTYLWRFRKRPVRRAHRVSASFPRKRGPITTSHIDRPIAIMDSRFRGNDASRDA